MNAVNILHNQSQWLGLIAFLLISLTFIFDWAYKSVLKIVKPTLIGTRHTFRQKYCIQFWTIAIRNFVIVISLLFARPQYILYYVVLIGGYLTAKKGVRTVSLAKKQDILS